VNEVVTAALARLSRRVDLSDGEIEAAFAEILEGRVSDVQTAGFVIALRTKGETTSELAAIVRTMRRYSARVEVAPGAIDTCGTGGDRSGTVNVSTMAALVAAGAGAHVVKHGNRAASSHCGSADVLEALGVAIELAPEGVARCVEEAGIGFCFAPRYHPALRHLGPARKELAVATTFNFLGPLANPAHVTRQAIGVSDPSMAQPMLATLAALGTERALVFHGDDGLDELTTTTTSTVHELAGGDVRTFTLDPSELGIDATTADLLTGGDATANAARVHAVLGGERGPAHDIVVLNAAAALYVAGIAADIGAGVDAARASIDDGAAAKALDALVRVSTAEQAGAARPGGES
jgi:anthranilate phosphoribosyltransferase